MSAEELKEIFSAGNSKPRTFFDYRHKIEAAEDFLLEHGGFGVITATELVDNL